MALSVVLKKGLHFCTTLPSGELMCDESSEVGNAHPSAPELLLASLGSCIGSVLAYFAGRRGLSLEGMKIDLDYNLAEKPHRIGEIGIRVTLPKALSGQEQQTLERVAHACLIHNTLTHPPKITLTLTGSPHQ